MRADRVRAAIARQRRVLLDQVAARGNEKDAAVLRASNAMERFLGAQEELDRAERNLREQNSALDKADFRYAEALRRLRTFDRWNGVTHSNDPAPTPEGATP